METAPMDHQRCGHAAEEAEHDDQTNYTHAQEVAISSVAETILHVLGRLQCHVRRCVLDYGAGV